jgi:cytochrome b6-f complex iron-sulfur subunit
MVDDLKAKEKACSGNIYTSKRDFFTLAGWAVLATTVAVYASKLLGPKAIGGFFFPKVLFEPSPVFSIGYPADYAPGTVTTLKTGKVFIVREGDSFKAISVICQHLGCAVHWTKEKNMFECPCHGSKYYKNGVNFAGPAPRPLNHFKVSLSDAGKLVVNTEQRVPIETELVV